MQKPSERHKLTSDNNIIKFKKPVHDPCKMNTANVSMCCQTALSETNEMTI